MNNRQKADLASLPAIITGMVLSKKHHDVHGTWFGVKGYGPIFRQNKIVSAVYLIALGTQLYFLFRDTKEQLDKVNDLDALIEENRIRLYDMEPSSEPFQSFSPVFAMGGTEDDFTCSTCGHRLDSGMRCPCGEVQSWQYPDGSPKLAEPTAAVIPLVQADGAETSIHTCSDAGHNGDETQMHEGPDGTWECPWAWEHSSSLADRIFNPPPSA
jgi:hypothetical protein